VGKLGTRTGEAIFSTSEAHAPPVKQLKNALVGAISVHFSSQTLLNKDRQCCELWREVELGVHAVWAVSDTTDKDRESICCAVRHTVTLPRAV